MKTIVILIWVFGCYGLFAQDNTFQISIQIIDQETKKGVADVGMSLLNLGAGTTDKDGMVRIPIPQGTETVELQIAKGFEIVNPPGPRLPVPGSTNAILQFWVKTVFLEDMKTKIDRLLTEKRELEGLTESLKTENDLLLEKNKHLTSAQTSLQDSIRQITLRIDSLQHKLQTVGREITVYKLAIFDRISRNYHQFLNAMLDMEMSLRNVSQAFIQEAALRQFNRQVENLNQARNGMHENHLSYIEAVEKYWDKNTSLTLKSLYDQALLNTYGKVILPLNEKLIARLNEAWNGHKPRILVQRKAVKSTEKALVGLHQELEDLQLIANELMVLLKET